MSNNRIDDFFKSHRIRILDDSKRAPIYRNVDNKFFTNSTDLNVVVQESNEFDTEPLYILEISKSELDKIVLLESQALNSMKQTGRYDLFQILLNQKEQEKGLRSQFPAVQKAYEHYSLMLKLAESGDL